MAGQRLRPAALIFAQPRSHDQGAGAGHHAAEGVHHARTGQIDRAVAQVPVDPIAASQPPPQTQLA